MTRRRRRRKQGQQKGFVVRRPLWESLQRKIELHQGADPRTVQEVIDGRYPLGTVDTLLESRLRGVDATLYNMRQFVQQREMKLVGGNLVWSKADVDALIDYLAERGVFTPEAARAAELGRTEEDYINLVTAISFAGDEVPAPS